MKNEVCVSGYVGSSGECNDCGSLDCHLARPAKMTSELRADLELQPCGPEALRIIDRLTAALEAEEHDHCEQRESRKYWEQKEGVAWARAEALQARVAELESALAAKAGYEAWMRAAKDLGAKLDVAESELADLRGRVERAKEALVSAPVSLDGRIARALEVLRGR